MEAIRDGGWAIAERIWQCDPPPKRSEEEWRAALDYLVGELSALLECPVRVEHHWIDDEEGHACRSICSRVTAVLSRRLRLVLFGSLCMTVNDGEAVGISADLMYFAEGTRLGSHRRSPSPRYLDVVSLVFARDASGRGRWIQHGLTIDEHGEWESYQEAPPSARG